jgi:hypothetical protein
MHRYSYVPGLSNVTVNVLPDPGYCPSSPFGRIQPELIYFSAPVMEKFALVFINWTLPCESLAYQAVDRIHI